MEVHAAVTDCSHGRCDW